MKKILFLDDCQERHDAVHALYDDYALVVGCFTLDQFLDALVAHDHFDAISLDHDLNDFESKSTFMDSEATGLDACGCMVNKRFKDKLPQTIRVHSFNPVGAMRMVNFLRDREFIVQYRPCDFNGLLA